MVLAILAAPLYGLRCPYIAIKHDSLMFGLREAFVALSTLDGITAGLGWNCRINPEVKHPGDEFTLPTEQETPGSEKYWPHFVAACKGVSRSSLEKGWMTSEDLEGCMPNVLQAVPAMAILDIIRRSVAAEPDVESIHWTEEDRCDAKTCRKDDLADFFWPKLMKVRKQVKEAKEEELDYLRAKLCANSEEVRGSIMRVFSLMFIFLTVTVPGSKEFSLGDGGSKGRQFWREVTSTNKTYLYDGKKIG